MIAKAIKGKGFRGALEYDLSKEQSRMIGTNMEGAKLSDHPLREGLREQAVTGLAGVFPKVGQYGRLAGFTNQQVEPNRTGRQPYVLAHYGTGKVAPAAQPYLAAIERPLRCLAAEKQRRVDAEKARWSQQRDRGPSL